MAYGERFRLHVEEVVKGSKRAPKPHQKSSAIPANMERINRDKRRKANIRKIETVKRREDKKKKSKEYQEEIREEWKAWRNSSIQKLDEHIRNVTPHLLIREPPEKLEDLSPYAAGHVMLKATTVRTFFFKMKQRDQDRTHHVDGGIFADTIAKNVGEEVGLSPRTVWNYYTEWRNGENQRWKELEKKVDKEDIDEETMNGLFEQLHQFDWSSCHKKSVEGGLLVNSMNVTYGGKGNKKLRCTSMTEGCVGEGIAMMYSKNPSVNICIIPIPLPLRKERSKTELF